LNSLPSCGHTLSIPLAGAVYFVGLSVEFGYEASFRYSLKFLIDDVILKKIKRFFSCCLPYLHSWVVYSVICVTCDYGWARYGAKIFTDLVMTFFSIYKSNLWSIITGKAVEI